MNRNRAIHPLFLSSLEGKDGRFKKCNRGLNGIMHTLSCKCGFDIEKVLFLNKCNQ